MAGPASAATERVPDMPADIPGAPEGALPVSMDAMIDNLAGLYAAQLRTANVEAAKWQAAAQGAVGQLTEAVEVIEALRGRIEALEAAPTPPRRERRRATLKEPAPAPPPPRSAVPSSAVSAPLLPDTTINGTTSQASSVGG
jgi:hypothetical protein